MAVLGIGGPQEQGEREIPPVNKFAVFLDNYLQQAQKAPTAIAGETAGIAIEEARDNTPELDQDTIDSWNKDVPNLNIPQGTREATGRVLLSNQMKKNLNTSIVNDPQNNGKIAWAGTILGGTQRFILDPTVVASALIGGGVAKGAALVGSRFLPEITSMAKFLPQAARAVKGGIEGGVFGFVDGLTRGTIEAKRRQVEEGEEIPSREVVKGAIDEAALTAGGGIVLDVAARGIGKGFRLLGDRKFNKQAVLDEELARREEDDNKKQFQDRVSKIRDNHLQSAKENIPRAQESVDKAFDSSESAIAKFKTEKPENREINGLSETLKTIKESDSPINEKIQGVALVRKELEDLSIKNDGVLKDNIKDINKNVDRYVNNLSQAKLSDDVSSLSRILSDFRMITPDDFSNLKKVAIAQMEEGRAANIEPYINELVLQNSQNLMDRLDETGINRGQVLHSILDSLDVIKGRQKDIEDFLKRDQDALKTTKGKGKRAELKGSINGRIALQTAVVKQRAVHELLATAITGGFKGNTGEDIASFLQNQLSRDSEVLGGYDNLLREMNSEPIEDILAKVEEKPEPFTPESKEDIEKIQTRKSLAAPLIEDAVKCILGQ